jgi:hypothetical protein
VRYKLCDAKFLYRFQVGQLVYVCGRQLERRVEQR